MYAAQPVPFPGLYHGPPNNVSEKGKGGKAHMVPQVTLLDIDNLITGRKILITYDEGVRYDFPIRIDW